MYLKKLLNNKALIAGILILIPIFIILLIVLCRQVIMPSDEDIVNDLKNTKCYSSKVEYSFINSKSESKESTMQYYSMGKGSRIEFNDGYKRVKVYKGGEIKVQGEDEEFTLDKDIDVIYPLAFIENILSNQQSGDIKEVKAEWGDGVYLQLDIEYNNKNKHLNKAEFYIDKNKKVPVLLKILDDNDKERILITYKDFKKEKNLNNNLF
ncbi:putative secreted protein [Clostridium sp. DL-VIII]|uniref:germination lipoprotein GerS-related protein n=1 Tax=Clostridium sp. DL-VIII TaxID=641107 RepID=UPI00023B02FC|nr:germination lipoprotein GerS-related protein [Clostridium sp. DL-VIII]EHJ02304.1 putative secreted protein [Clostridium sp. DL-VIII]